MFLGLSDLDWITRIFCSLSTCTERERERGTSGGVECLRLFWCAILVFWRVTQKKQKKNKKEKEKEKVRFLGLLDPCFGPTPDPFLLSLIGVKTVS